MFPKLIGKKFNFFCFAELLFFCHNVNFYGRNEGDPLSPQKGEATQGEHLLDPPLFFSVFLPHSPEIPGNLSDARAARANGTECNRAPGKGILFLRFLPGTFLLHFFLQRGY
jgi:hypothetical protein